MKLLNFQLFSAIVLVSSVLAAADDDGDDHGGEDAGALTQSTFTEGVASTPHFIMFFAPWCGHCKRLAPTWNKLTEKFAADKSLGVVVAKVDCTVETELCSSQTVKGYPTIKFFKNGVDSGVKYKGQRALDDLNRYIDEQMGRAHEEEEKVALDPEVPAKENGLYVLNERSFKAHVAKGETFVKFYAPWCGHCKKLAPTWEKLAKKMDADPSMKVTVAKVDCTEAEELCQSNDVSGYPTLAFYRDGDKVETYRGGRTIGDLTDYVSVMAAGGGEAGAKEDEEEAKDEKVLKIDKESFDEAIGSAGVTFVKFFAPWCGHCKRIAPIWEQLAEKYAERGDEVRIAKVDCTSNENKNKDLCNNQGVNGFPTLNIYGGGRKLEEYAGKRTLEDLEAFIEKALKGGGAAAAAAKEEL